MSVVASSSRAASLSHAQREAVCEFLLQETRERIGDDDTIFRLCRGSFRLLDALDWRRDVPDRAAYRVVVDPDIAWLVTEILEPYARDWAEPLLERWRSEPAAPDWVEPGSEAWTYWAERRDWEVAYERGILGATTALRAVA